MNSKIFIYLILIIVFFWFLPIGIFAKENTYEGIVNKVIEQNGNYQKLEVKNENDIYLIENGVFESSNNIQYKVGDKVVVTDGIISDFVRRPFLFILFSVFIIVSVVIAGKWGITSFLGMGYSFYVIFVFILPMILKGYDAVTVSIIGSMFIIPVTFFLSHGINRKTISAIIGTVITMVVIGLLAFISVEFAKLTGFAVEEASFLQYQLGNTLNLKGILLAGIIISSLGVLDDITISQASIVEELKNANSKLSKKELFVRSMKVGKDHISSMVNTLVLVYSGAALPLLLLFVNNPHPFSEVINYEIIADEIVRTLVGSIGLILAVPITSYIASQFSGIKIPKK
jgi:uncharacterized membrane protein